MGETDEVMKMKSVRRIGYVVLALVVIAGLAVLGIKLAHDRSSATPSSQTTLPPKPAKPSPPPKSGACYNLSFAQATQATATTTTVPCSSRHTSLTFYVGRLNPVRDGHQMAIDSATVQQQMSRRCPAKLTSYLGGTQDTQRLSQFQSVWFGPDLKEYDAGARWYRCDLVAIKSHNTLQPLKQHLHGVLSHPGALNRWGACSTSTPSPRGFQHVICSQPHKWHAAQIVPFPKHTKFHGKAAGASASATCKSVASAKAAGAMKYSWSLVWPTQQQWQNGQHYAYCWLPG